jgi:hypothetical protein
MKSMTFGVFYSPWPPGFSMATPSNGSLKVKWRKLLFLKSNPRDLGYMQRLFEEQHPGARLIDATKETKWPALLEGADRIVLLYPDPIGLGFGPVEKELRSTAPKANIEVLNGRRRRFALDAQTSSALRWRRFLSYTMLPEFAMTAAFLLWTPVLLVVDALRGKR